MNTIFDKLVGAVNCFFGVIRLVVIILIALIGLMSIFAGSLGGLFGSLSMLIASIMFFEIYRVVCLKDQKVTIDIPEAHKPE